MVVKVDLLAAYFPGHLRGRAGMPTAIATTTPGHLTDAAQKMNPVLMKLDLWCRTMVLSSCLFAPSASSRPSSGSRRTRSASVTDSVPSAESLRPVNGNTSGPRWHWQLMLTRQTWLTSGSTSAPICAGPVPKMLTCCPWSEVMMYSSAVSTLERHHRHHRAELLLAVELHALASPGTRPPGRTGWRSWCRRLR